MTNNNTNNNIVLHSIIVVLILVIAGLGFYITQESSNYKVVETNKIEETNNKEVVKDDKATNSDIKVTVYGDKRCIECATEAITSQLKMVPSLSGVNFEIKDFSDEGVKETIEAKNIKVLPAFVFNTGKIDAGIDPYLQELTDGTFNLAIGASFDPFAEICDNGVDDTGNGEIDCADSTCAGSSLCREEVKAKLDVFLMGYCPFGEIAAKAIPDLQKTFGDDLNIDLHYIATKSGEGDKAEDFQSLHGTPESEENIRQLCVKKHYGIDTNIAYLQTRYQNADNYGKVTDEPSVAYEANGIDANTIDDCVVNGEGGKLLEEDIKLAKELGIGASPTWLANNKYSFGGIQASAIQAEFCKYNPELKGCETIIEEATPASNGQPSCN